MTITAEDPTHGRFRRDDRAEPPWRISTFRGQPSSPMPTTAPPSMCDRRFARDGAAHHLAEQP
ncbi:hypothetical protein, partial [Rhodococcus sp. NCIMB 12038]|uniref:hypothetical protein n=1 Tax=Rhodococcus sp. NCIMB 12038 TaxID=933800 RepID=UPI000B554EB5